MPAQPEKHVIVMTTDVKVRDFPWVLGHMPGGSLEWFSYGIAPNARWEEVVRPSVPRLRMAVQSALKARLRKADMVISHGPRATLWTALAMRAAGVRAHHLAFAFNFTELPSEPMRSMMRVGFSMVDRFVTPSTFEKQLYARTFGIPLERFEMVHFGIEKPIIHDKTLTRPSARPYICAIGGEGRDYRTLLQAMALIPDIDLICVARPHNVQGMTIPPNVKILTNVPNDVCWNVMEHAAFVVIPLLSREVPCGHVTMVASMHFAKAIVATDSDGVTDYVREGENALLCRPSDPAAMAETITRLMKDPQLAERLGATGLSHAREHCSEKAVIGFAERYLTQAGLL